MYWHWTGPCNLQTICWLIDHMKIHVQENMDHGLSYSKDSVIYEYMYLQFTWILLIPFKEPVWRFRSSRLIQILNVSRRSRSRRGSWFKDGATQSDGRCWTSLIWSRWTVSLQCRMYKYNTTLYKQLSFIFFFSYLKY